MAGFGALSLALVGAAIAVALLARRAARIRRRKEAVAAAASAVGADLLGGAHVQTAGSDDRGLCHVA